MLRDVHFLRLLFVFLLGSAGLGFSETVTVTGSLTNTYPGTLHPTYRVGYWIWTDKMLDQQTCRFWKSFNLTRSVVSAHIRIAADNSYQLYLDGREIGRGGEWRSLNDYDVSQVLAPGPHFITVEAFSDYAAAGLVVGFHAELDDASIVDVGTDNTWRIVPNDERHWETRKRANPDWKSATMYAAYMEGPWRQNSARVFQCLPIQPEIIRFWQRGWFQITLLSICGIAILFSLHLASKLALQSKTQQFLQRERARIARDIHDDVGARLSHLVLMGERAQRELPADQSTRAQFNQMCENTRAVLGAIDEVVWTVNSRRDTVQDFETYVCNYTEAFLRATPIRCWLDVDSDIPASAFDLAIRRNLFLAIKEALNNAAKYSEATELFLRIHIQGEEMIVVVEDNGKGFSPEHTDSTRNGLTNMRQRVEEVGGRCRIESQPGKGCKVEFITPLVHGRGSRSRWWQRLKWPSVKKVNPTSTPTTTPASDALKS